MAEGGANTVLTTKAARHGVIREVLASNPVGSQGELRGELSRLGIETTQATLSRDLLELRATKVRNEAGALIYTLADGDGALIHDADGALEKLARWCETLLIGSDTTGPLLVIRTPVGAANLLAAAIDSARLEGILGTIAGDDTILVTCRSPEEARTVAVRLVELAEPKEERSGE